MLKNYRAIITFLLTGALFLHIGCDEKKPGGSFKTPEMQRAEKLYKEGRRLFLTCDPNNYEDALNYFNEALSINSDYAEALAASAETISMWQAYRMNEPAFENAMHRAQRATRLAPELDMGYRAAADIYRHHRNPETGNVDTEYALDMIERALELNPRSAENLYVQGSIYLAKDPMKAVEILEKGKKMNPDLGKVYFNLASAHKLIADRIYTQKQKMKSEGQKVSEDMDRDMNTHYAAAEKNYRTYQELVPGDLGGYCALGIVYLHQGKTEKAEEMLNKTVTINPNPDPSQFKWLTKAYYHLASIAQRSGNPEDAYIYNKSALEKSPGRPDFIAQQLGICRELERTECVKKNEAKLEELKKKQEEFVKKREEEKKQDTEGGGTVEGPASLEE